VGLPPKDVPFGGTDERKGPEGAVVAPKRVMPKRVATFIQRGRRNYCRGAEGQQTMRRIGGMGGRTLQKKGDRATVTGKKKPISRQEGNDYPIPSKYGVVLMARARVTIDSLGEGHGLVPQFLDRLLDERMSSPKQENDKLHKICWSLGEKRGASVGAQSRGKISAPHE